MGEALDTRDHIVRSVATLATALVVSLVVLWVVAGLFGFGTAIGLIFAGVCFVMLPYVLPADWPPVTSATLDRGLGYVKRGPGGEAAATPAAAPAPVAAPAPSEAPEASAPSAPLVATEPAPAAEPTPVSERAPVAAPAPAPVLPAAAEETAPQQSVAAQPVTAQAAVAPSDDSGASAISARVREAARAAGEAARLLAGDVAAPAANAKPTGLAAPRASGADDLKRIKGVGPKLEALLHDLGVYHFDQIAAWGPAEIAWIDAHIDGFSGRATRDDWIGQAKLLAAGGETEHSKRVDSGLST